MVPVIYQAVFPSLNPFWQAFVQSSAPAPVPAAIPSEPATETPRAAADAMVDFWLGASESAGKFWSGPSSPMAMAPQLALAAQAVVVDAMAPKARSGSWYRTPLGTQDIASGAFGFMAGPFAALLPAFTAAAPFWAQVTASAAPAPFSVAAMPLPTIPAMWADQPWAQMWMNALTATQSAMTSATVAPVETASDVAAAVMPTYQSDSGHAVAQILHTTARAMVAVLPLIAMLVAMVTTLAQQSPLQIV